MTPNRLKLATVILTACGLFAAGPAWSAGTAGPEVKKVAKAKPKAKKRARVAKKPVHAQMETVLAVAPASAAVPAPPVVPESAVVASSVAAPAPSGETAASGNPYLSRAVAKAGPAGNPYLPGSTVALGNPYLAAPAVSPAPAAATPSVASIPTPPPAMTAAAPSAATAAAPSAAYIPSVNPYLAKSVAEPAASQGIMLAGPSSFRIRDLLPSLPEGQSLLPTVKKVYPTGEKPLVVITFKCPTELVGITPAPTKLLHEGVNGLFDIVNATDLLSFNLQQVCQ